MFGIPTPGRLVHGEIGRTEHLRPCDLDRLDMPGPTNPWPTERRPIAPGPGPRAGPGLSLGPGGTVSGWLVAIPYRLGAALEPAASGRAHDPPLLTRQRIDAGTVAAAEGRTDVGGPGGAFCVGPVRSTPGRAAYLEMVRRALELIRAGDVYQVNLGHELRARFDGCPRSFFADLSGHARPAHGAYMEWDAPGPDGTARRTALCSVSPELFLSFDPRTRVLTTRPMKGTRPISAGPAALRDAAKDRAELAMIVDLMRNDLGRIAVTGSVRVESASDVEAHAGSVLQATATVSCRVREGVGLAGMLRAAFPAGSITGAPKIRAMQVIDELEPFERGHWCGSIGFVGDDGRFTLSVAIRTATIAGPVDPSDPASIVGGRLSFPVGAGIVADSDPQAEWRETLLKARVLTRVLRDAATPRHRPPASTA